MSGNWKQKAEQAFDFPAGSLSGDTRMEIYAGRRAVIDGECELREYEEDTLLLQTKSGGIRLRGRELHITCFEKRYVVVDGRLSGLEFE